MRASLLCSSIVLLYVASFASGSLGATLVAPVYIEDERCTSSVSLANTSQMVLDPVIVFNSLEGQESARKKITLDPLSRVTVNVGDIPMGQRRFGTLGSISVMNISARDLTATLTIRCSGGNDHLLMEELQPLLPGATLQAGFLPELFSAPVIAIHSVGQFQQRISVQCIEENKRSYESQFTLPAGMTFLLNACITRQAESRTYAQLLTGSLGRELGDSTIKVKVLEPQNGAVSVWGFAVTKDSNLGLQLIPIEFTEWNSAIEFLLD
jgi:hypothetical protein